MGLYHSRLLVEKLPSPTPADADAGAARTPPPPPLAAVAAAAGPTPPGWTDVTSAAATARVHSMA